MEPKNLKLDSAVFYTKDLAQAIDFYRDTLSWELDYMQEGRFASFKLANAKLGIKQAKEAREIPGHQTIFIEADDIEVAYKDLQAKNIHFSKELKEEDWATNFSFLDPDDNKVLYVKYPTKQL